MGSTLSFPPTTYLLRGETVYKVKIEKIMMTEFSSYNGVDEFVLNGTQWIRTPLHQYQYYCSLYNWICWHCWRKLSKNEFCCVHVSSNVFVQINIGPTLCCRLNAEAQLENPVDHVQLQVQHQLAQRPSRHGQAYLGRWKICLCQKNISFTHT